MATLERPKLRPLSARRHDHEGQAFVALEDPLGVAQSPVFVPLEGFEWVVCNFDGNNTLLDIQAHVLRQTGRLISSSDLEALVVQLDRAMLLDGPTFEAFHDAYRLQGVRPAAHAGGSYAGTERALRAQLARFFVDPQGAVEPTESDRAAKLASETPLRGVISPHIDFGRGGTVYTWAYKELIEKTKADVFVIFGVAHQYCRRRFALTLKDFETPLGLVKTERAYVARLAELAGGDPFEDELAHRTEHSIEFQVVFLQYLLGDRRDFSIVPVLIGSFQDILEAGRSPIEDEEVKRFVAAARRTEEAYPGRVAYIGGIDFGHIGPDFGDADLVDDPTLEKLRAFDAGMIARLTRGDAEGWFSDAAASNNRFRVCGLAATYTLLKTLGPVQGRLLRYDRTVNAERTCCVSFAALALDASADSTNSDAAQAAPA